MSDQFQRLHAETQEAVKLVNGTIAVLQAQLLELERCVSDLMAAREKMATLAAPSAGRPVQRYSL